jgi:hypothetical protein
MNATRFRGSLQGFNFPVRVQAVLKGLARQRVCIYDFAIVNVLVIAIIILYI